MLWLARQYSARLAHLILIKNNVGRSWTHITVKEKEFKNIKEFSRVTLMSVKM